MNSDSNSTFKPRFLSFNAETNALDYLEKAFLFIKAVESDDTAWKWVIISLHGALYGFAISASRGTSNIAVTTKTKKGAEQLISFRKALDRCQDPEKMTMTIHSQTLVLTRLQKIAIDQLHNSFRNQFVHFVPTNLHISLHGIPQMCLHCLPVIEFLALKTGNYVHLSPHEKDRVGTIVQESEQILKSSLLYRESVEKIVQIKAENPNIAFE